MSVPDIANTLVEAFFHTTSTENKFLRVKNTNGKRPLTSNSRTPMITLHRYLLESWTNFLIEQMSPMLSQKKYPTRLSQLNLKRAFDIKLYHK